MDSLIRALHASCSSTGRRFVISVAGGGLSGANLMLSTPGASKSVLEVNCPYSRLSFVEFIAPMSPPTSFASTEAALLLARASLSRARKLCLGEENLVGASLAVGVGAVAALMSETSRMGSHRCHVAICNNEREDIWSLHFSKGARSREEEEEVCGRAVVGAAASSAGIFPTGMNEKAKMVHALGNLFGSMENDDLFHSSSPLATPLDRLLFGQQQQQSLPSQAGVGEPVTHVFFPPPTPQTSTHTPIINAPMQYIARSRTLGTPSNSTSSPRLLLLPGSFNPRHHGHTSLGMAAVSVLARQHPESPPPLLVYELSVVNVDKPSLEAAEVTRRLLPFASDLPQPQNPAGSGGLCVTNAPTFSKKATLFPGAAFAVGWDTAARIVSPAYYAGGEEAMLRALEDLIATGTLILVAGRRAGSAALPKGFSLSGVTPETFLSLNKHLLPSVPPRIHPLFLEISDKEFRADVSSSEIRDLNISVVS